MNGPKESINLTGPRELMNAADQLRFKIEWHDPGAARGEELRATWASLTVLVEDTHVTELMDKGAARSSRTEIFLPLFPIAEWIAEHWWFLQAEAENEGKKDFDRRHNLRWAREGFVFPSLCFVTRGENVSVKWKKVSYPSASICFLSEGHRTLPAAAVFDELRVLVNAVLARLEDFGLTQTSLHEQWQAIETADSQEQEFCRAAARLGVDPYAIDSHEEQVLLDVAGRTRPELLDELLCLAGVDDLRQQAAALQHDTNSISSDDDRIDALAALRNRAPVLQPQQNPWETGYEFARQLRSRLNGGPWKSDTLKTLAGHLGIDLLDHCLSGHPPKCRIFAALMGTNQHNNPKFILSGRREDSRQFAFCRALFEHLTVRPKTFAAVSKLRTERQAMNRAFAAEFLAPHEMLRKELSGELVDEEEIEDLADTYGVATRCILDQIRNHGLARIATDSSADFDASQ